MRLWLWYGATRALMFWLLFAIEYVVLSDPKKWLVDLDAAGPGTGLPEYPWPAAYLLYLPVAIGVPTILHYFAIVVLCMLAVDAVLTWWLWRAAGKHIANGVWLWLLVVPALGPVAFARYDILPAALTALALLCMTRARFVRAGVFAAAGAGLKLWPAVALPALLLPGERDARLRLLSAFAACALVLIVATLLAAGGERLVSPFAAQAQRGLQIEAFTALPLLWARYFEGGSLWTVQFAACHCHELFGPGVNFALHAATAITAAGAVFILMLYLRAFAATARSRTPERAALLTAFAIVVWIVGAKVFSPQYLLWLAAPLAVLGVLPGRAAKRTDVALLAAAAALTHFVYPMTYEALLVERHFFQAFTLVALSVRDGLLVALAWRLGWRAWEWA